MNRPGSWMYHFPRESVSDDCGSGFNVPSELARFQIGNRDETLAAVGSLEFESHAAQLYGVR